MIMDDSDGIIDDQNDDNYDNDDYDDEEDNDDDDDQNITQRQGFSKISFFTVRLIRNS